MRTDIDVWWLDSDQCKKTCNGMDMGHYDLPRYIREEVRSLAGRNGKGMLWVSPEISGTANIPFKDQPLAEAAARCGGIVFNKEDSEQILHLVRLHELGFVTDMNLALMKS